MKKIIRFIILGTILVIVIFSGKYLYNVMTYYPKAIKESKSIESKVKKDNANEKEKTDF